MGWHLASARGSEHSGDADGQCIFCYAKVKAAAYTAAALVF